MAKLVLLFFLKTVCEIVAQPNLPRIRVVDSDPSPSQLPLGECIGDCDVDNDCEAGLFCFQRTRFDAVPGCSGGNMDGSFSDYCIRSVDIDPLSSSRPTLPPIQPPVLDGFPSTQIVGNNVFQRYPLQECQGDCDARRDCAGPLVCHQRDRNQTVFGCVGGLADSSQMDYCTRPDSVIPSDERPPLPYTSEPFRLKLYWEEGYRWQEETVEREWCMMMYNYRGANCWNGLRTERCDQNSMYISRCERDEVRQEFSFVYLEDSEEIQIKIGSGFNSCFQRDGRNVVLRYCDPEEPRQRWFAQNGDFHAYRFEISPKTLASHCITQAHHPKEGELVELQPCRVSAEEQTSYWNAY